MARSVDQQINRIKTKITKLPKRLSGGIMLESLALKGESTIKRRTRNGFGITKWLGRLKSLRIKKSTVKVRDGLKDKGTLSNKTAPQVANLTRTGHMLDFIHITKKTNTIFEMRPDAADRSKTADLLSRGIMYFGFTLTEFKAIKKLANSFIKAEIKKLFR